MLNGQYIIWWLAVFEQTATAVYINTYSINSFHSYWFPGFVSMFSVCTLWAMNVRKPDDNNKHLSKWKNFRPTLRWHMTLDCVRPIQSSVIRIIHRNVDLKCFFSILPKCLFDIIVIHAYFIRISQGSVETHLRRGGIYNNHIIANCLQSVSAVSYTHLTLPTNREV